MQARQHFLGVVADRRNNSHAGDDDAGHGYLPKSGRRQARAGARGYQAHAHIGDFVNPLAVRLQPAIGDGENELAPEDALEIDPVDHLLHRRDHHVGELDLADAERPAASRQPEPTEEEPGHLPQRVEAQAARHHRIALEMAAEKPEVGLDVEFRAHHPFAMRAAGLGDLGNPVEHQHGRQRQLRIAGAEQLAAPAGQQVLIVEL